MLFPPPRLRRCVQANGVVIHTDEEMHERSRIRVAFSERTGGVSRSPWNSLNLAGHVGDEGSDVTENRARFLSAVGAEPQNIDLVIAEQVHGDSIAIIDHDMLGRGEADYDDPFIAPGTDAFLTDKRDVALLMLYADCVPIILVAETPTPTIGVVHAGWRGVLSSLPERAAAELLARAGCLPQDVSVYIGPHIGSCCFRVSEELLMEFSAEFGDSVLAGANVDLHAAVAIGLARAGISSDRITSLRTCTVHNTDRFFSYRANRITGRHGALAIIE